MNTRMSDFDVAILGGGVVGITTAYYALRQARMYVLWIGGPRLDWRPASPMEGRSPSAMPSLGLTPQPR
jgi:thioredoxin reductase